MQKSQSSKFTARARTALLGLSLCCAGAAALAQVQDWQDVRALLDAGKAAEALKLADTALASKPGDARMQLQRGIVLTALDRQSEAVAVFQAMITAHPELPGPYNNLAVIYSAQGDYDKARQALENAIRVNPGYAIAHQNLGDLHSRLAAMSYQKSQALDKNDASTARKLLAVSKVLELGPAPTLPAKAAAAVTASPAPMSSVKAAPVAASAASADATRQALSSAVQRWAQAWSRRDMGAYLAAYAPDFKGQAADRKTWEAERRARIIGKKKISVELANFDTKLDGEQAEVRFRQTYRADTFENTSDKTLSLRRNATGAWLIYAETGR